MRNIIVVAFGILSILPAAAQVIDLSKPDTGKSRFAINTDGSPREIGTSAQPPAPVKPAGAKAEGLPWASQQPQQTESSDDHSHRVRVKPRRYYRY